MFERRLALLACCLAMTVQATPHGELRDPTRPSGRQLSDGDGVAQNETAATPLQLQGMLSRGGERTALINGRRVAVGDRVDNAQVVAIEINRVMLDQDGETIELVVGAGPVKAPTTDNEVNQ